jgi:peptidoglycan hydrolase CwlO-like protein
MMGNGSVVMLGKCMPIRLITPDFGPLIMLGSRRGKGPEILGGDLPRTGASKHFSGDRPNHRRPGTFRRSAMPIVRTVVRAGVITAVVGGAALVVAGPDRAFAVFHQTRSKMNTAIDARVTDPVALRAQLKDLESQYPKRIADVRGDLAELNEQLSQLERELEVSRKVVHMADADLDQMQDVLARAEEARAEAAGHVIRVRFDDNRPMSLDDAYSKANRVSQVRSAYATRAADIERDLGYLGQQKERLDTLLAELETERADFQTQLWQLDRQVDAIARNDRMIELMQKREATIENQSRYRAASLDQVTGRLADIRAKQESKLQMYSQSTDVKNYENAAKYLLDSEVRGNAQGPPSTSPRRLQRERSIEIAPSVIEIGPAPREEGRKPGDQVASKK